MPSGGSWTASQDTLAYVALIFTASTPVTLAEGYKTLNLHAGIAVHSRIAAGGVCSHCGVPGPAMVWPATEKV